MSNIVHFMNNGPFDVRAMLTFGISAKENENAIGFFGTGFKYAVAIILRLGGKISIKTNGETYLFAAQKQEIRGQEFNVVYMNDREAGFTTHLGINWEPWMAFRELYCNCKDENGVIDTSAQAFDTIITVDCRQIADAFADKDRYFVNGTPIHSTAEIDIYDKPSQYYFYRGVAVSSTAQPAMWTYNIKSRVELSEERIAKHSHQISWPIMRAVQNFNDATMMRRILTADRESEEAKFRFDKDCGVSDVFMQVARQLLMTDVGLRESPRALLKAMDEKAGNWPDLFLTKVQLGMLQKAIKFLNGLYIHPESFEIRTVEGLGDGVMGRALDGVIYLSALPFQMGTKQVASTLLEEWVHLKHGCEDFDRTMQSWLFDKILSLGEEMVGEPV